MNLTRCQTATHSGLLFFYLLFFTAAVPSLCAQSVEVSGQDTLAAQKTARSPKGAMFRSLLPGWGQFYNGQFIKGSLVIVGQGLLVYNAVRFDRKADEADPGSAEHNFYVDRRNLMYWLMGGVTLLSMVDAYIDAHFRNFDAGPDLSLRIGAMPDHPDRIGISLNARL